MIMTRTPQFIHTQSMARVLLRPSLWDRIRLVFRPDDIPRPLRIAFSFAPDRPDGEVRFQTLSAVIHVPGRVTEIGCDVEVVVTPGRGIVFEGVEMRGDDP